MTIPTHAYVPRTDDPKAMEHCVYCGRADRLDADWLCSDCRPPPAPTVHRGPNDSDEMRALRERVEALEHIHDVSAPMEPWFAGLTERIVKLEKDFGKAMWTGAMRAMSDRVFDLERGRRDAESIGVRVKAMEVNVGIDPDDVSIQDQIRRVEARVTGLDAAHDCLAQAVARRLDALERHSHPPADIRQVVRDVLRELLGER